MSARASSERLLTPGFGWWVNQGWTCDFFGVFFPRSRVREKQNELEWNGKEIGWVGLGSSARSLSGGSVRVRGRFEYTREINTMSLHSCCLLRREDGKGSFGFAYSLVHLVLFWLESSSLITVD